MKLWYFFFLLHYFLNYIKGCVNSCCHFALKSKQIDDFVFVFQFNFNFVQDRQKLFSENLKFESTYKIHAYALISTQRIEKIVHKDNRKIVYQLEFRRCAWIRFVFESWPRITFWMVLAQFQTRWVFWLILAKPEN